MVGIEFIYFVHLEEDDSIEDSGFTSIDLSEDEVQQVIEAVRKKPTGDPFDLPKLIQQKMQDAAEEDAKVTFAYLGEKEYWVDLNFYLPIDMAELLPKDVYNLLPEDIRELIERDKEQEEEWAAL